MVSERKGAEEDEEREKVGDLKKKKKNDEVNQKRNGTYTNKSKIIFQ